MPKGGSRMHGLIQGVEVLDCKQCPMPSHSVLPTNNAMMATNATRSGTALHTPLTLTAA